MPEARIVINTGPLIALTAGLGRLDVLATLYSQVIVPFEVGREMLASNATRFAADEYVAATWLDKLQKPSVLQPVLANALDPGEAAVIQTAIDEGIVTVCIDEAAGRRVARLFGLKVTGSLGILLRAKREGYPVVLRDAVDRMRQRGIWIADTLVSDALTQAGELP